MKITRQVLCAVLMAAIVASAGAACFPSGAEAGFGHLTGCLTGALGGGRLLCKFGPWWCAGGLVGGCVVGVIAYEFLTDR